MSYFRRYALLIAVATFSRMGLCQCVAPQFREPQRNNTRLNLPRVVDLNDDGALDLVSGSTVLLAGRGDGTFGEPVAVGPHLRGGGVLLVGDVNNDGRPDLVVPGGDVVEPCGGGKAGAALLSSPNGLFLLGPGFWGAGESVAADWDGDGFLDLIGGGVFDGRCGIAVRRGDGTGAFGDALAVGAGSLEDGESLLVVADFDGDGRLGLAYTARVSDTSRRLRVLERGSDGTLNATPAYEADFVAGTTRILRAGDFNNDGRPDLLVQSADAFITFLNHGGGSFEAVRSPLDGVAVIDYVLADFNGDGALDIAALRAFRQGFSSSVVIFCGDGAGRFTQCATVPLPTPISGWVCVGDFNGDGRPDIAADGDTGGFFVALNDCPAYGRLAGVLPSAVSSGGLSGAFFKTRLSIENPCTEEIEGRLVFHPRERPGSDSDRALPFRLGPAAVLRLDDAVSRIGESGSGSIDVLVTRGRDPAIRAEVFNSSFGDAVRGCVEPAVCVREVLTAGTGGDLVAPVDLVRYRFAVGLRTMAEGASLRATVRDSLGHVLKVVHRSFEPYRTVQEPAQEFLGGIMLTGRETVSVSLLEGGAIVFATTADNGTSTPAIQIPLRR